MSQYSPPMEDDLPILYNIIEPGPLEHGLLSRSTVAETIRETAPAPVTVFEPAPRVPLPALTQNEKAELALEVRLAVLNELQTELGLSLQQNLEQVMEEAIQETIEQTIEQITASLTSELQSRLRSSLQTGLQACLYAAIDEAVSKNLAAASQPASPT